MLRASRGGAVGGLVAGLVLMLYMLGGALLQGREVWPLLKGAAAPLLGARALQPGFDPPALLLGLLCHLAVAVAWGILFGIVFWGASRAATLWGGLAWGVVVWLAMYFVVLPTVGMGEYSLNAPIAPALATHLVFGVSLAIAFLPFQVSKMRTWRRSPTQSSPTGYGGRSNGAVAPPPRTSPR